ncbi:MAG: hypothetical protein E7560_05465 [Ruminococcaceae bacterium]|nr:hypothetical protein [Oscillospiraceae bacterium]
MLTLGPLKEKEKARDLFLLKNIDYNDDSQCVVCNAGEEILGFCLFDLNEEKMVVKYIEPLDDISLADGILRSTLHVAAERSIMNAYYSDTVPEEFLYKLLFIENEKEKKLNINKLFESCKGCGG